MDEFKMGAVVAMDARGRLVWQITHQTAQGCWCEPSEKNAPPGFTLVSSNPPSDCMGGETIYHKPLTAAHAESLRGIACLS